ncbi:hypothetical protein SK128_020311, partial [Halocaridina rubra]
VFHVGAFFFGYKAIGRHCVPVISVPEAGGLNQYISLRNQPSLSVTEAVPPVSHDSFRTISPDVSPSKQTPKLPLLSERVVTKLTEQRRSLQFTESSGEEESPKSADSLDPL